MTLIFYSDVWFYILYTKIILWRYSNLAVYSLAITSSVLFDVVIIILTAGQTWIILSSGSDMRSYYPLYSLLLRDGEGYNLLQGNPTN